MRHATNLLVSICLLLLALPLSAHALESDKKAPLNITADGGTYNFKSGVDIFEGHVKIDQGTTHILADKLITKKDKHHTIQEAIAYGISSLAEVWTVPKPGEETLHAKAKVIRYYPKEENMTLEKDVYVEQGKNHFQGQLIHYNSREQTINVPASDNAKAVLVYHPKS